jgi:hypothetical protein
MADRGGSGRGPDRNEAMSERPLSLPTRLGLMAAKICGSVNGNSFERLYSAKRRHQESRLNVKANYLVPLLCQFFETFDDVSIF